MSRRTMAGHLANTQRTHDGAAVCRTTPNDFDVLRSPTKPFQLSAQTKYLFEGRGVTCMCPLGIVPPSPPQHVGGEHYACSRSIGICLGRIAIFRPGQNRKSDLS